MREYLESTLDHLNAERRAAERRNPAAVEMIDRLIANVVEDLESL